MRRFILFMLIYWANISYSETIGNRYCLFESGQNYSSHCYRNLADCERHVADQKTYALHGEMICKVR